ncbi:MAG: hypothetical protein KDA63_05800 [Planctomycetales bacterium]|nr:hypothetical protein [Planctomycetales bacterium]
MADEFLALVNKRLTLNVLIQGAASHSYLTLHHLVKPELDAIDPALVPLYDKLAVSFDLNQWYGDLVPLVGMPRRFWRRLPKSDHPFRRHPLLATHGAALAEASRRYATDRARVKSVCWFPLMHSPQMYALITRVLLRERRHKTRLADVARTAASLLWGIDEDRLVAELTGEVAFGNIPPPQSFVGKLLKVGAVGYSGVSRRGGRLDVVAKAIVWPLLGHELVKGTAELVCLHGLNRWDEQTYLDVLETTDLIEYEPWHMQAGAELWRRLLRLLDRERTLPEQLMHIARLEPAPLEELVLAIVEQPERARQMIAELN